MEEAKQRMKEAKKGGGKGGAAAAAATADEGKSGKKGSKRKLGDDDDTLSDEVSVGGAGASEVRLRIPGYLKKQLIADWEAVTRNHRLVTLPRPMSVKALLREFEESKQKQESSHLMVKEIRSGLEQYFEKALGTVLLYRFERPQFKAQQAAAATEGKTLGDIYGAEHLLRLFGNKHSGSSAQHGATPHVSSLLLSALSRVLFSPPLPRVSLLSFSFYFSSRSSEAAQSAVVHEAGAARGDRFGQQAQRLHQVARQEGAGRSAVPGRVRSHRAGVHAESHGGGRCVRQISIWRGPQPSARALRLSLLLSCLAHSCNRVLQSHPPFVRISVRCVHLHHIFTLLFFDFIFMVVLSTQKANTLQWTRRADVFNTNWRMSEGKSFI